jgi:hypothetical protein
VVGAHPEGFVNGTRFAGVTSVRLVLRKVYSDSAYILLNARPPLYETGQILNIYCCEFLRITLPRSKSALNSLSH